MLMQHAQRAAAVLGHDAVAGGTRARPAGTVARPRAAGPEDRGWRLRASGRGGRHHGTAGHGPADRTCAAPAFRGRLGRFAASPLSAREARTPHLVAQGLTARQIAEALVVSKRTAENHVQHILAKLGLDNRAQIAAWVATRPTAQIE
ncbi:MAG: helix-turn-helix transcriptional regulator [Euzebyaceae bacterium]|nr:helix-turn-helix transcriptional regulator [Euzebyaceae bacterium]